MSAPFVSAPVVGAAVFVVAMSFAAGCTSASEAEPVAEVNGHRITAEELDRALGQPLNDLEQRIYEMRRQKLEELIGDRVLAEEAKKQNLTLDEFVDAEVAAKAAPVTDAELDAYCARRPSDCAGEGEDGAARRGAIRERLHALRVASLRSAYAKQLRENADVRVHLEPPTPYRAEVGEGTLPSRGSANAAVTIVEFSDYHCPFCKRVQPTLQKLLEAYPTQVRLVYRDNPIDQLHPQARRVAEAARCANDQGRFWEFHDRIYSGPPSTSPDVLRAAAEAAGVDVARMEQCLAAGTHRAAVQADIDEAARLGADATPVFFVNGRSVRGAQPYEVFEQVVEEELARLAGRPSSR